MSYSWHILYSMKHWLINVNEGFDNGSNPKSHLSILNYVRVGKNCVSSGDQDGTFMAPWERWETSLKPRLGRFRESFGSAAVGSMQELGSLGLMLHGATNVSCMREVCSWFGFPMLFHLFLQC